MTCFRVRTEKCAAVIGPGLAKPAAPRLLDLNVTNYLPPWIFY
ncbi:hypothetical protein OOU_Y34scaffold00147g20 [Pyricularia oryzae Y34]|uniref:Uncharacterized protein n=2 Tax=Pyricularia oryzae TaxID=318829 RepID=A0AA97PR18_PYRO3|nr:hypothetical protein OOU_Y34scaffold00147g20 [Pyricularia oryzae Y34]